jgi:hypothetical protein
MMPPTSPPTTPPAAPPAVLAQQVARARRRLFLQSLIDALVVAWSVALGLSALWLLVLPLLPATGAEWRWAAPGVAAAVATLLAVLVARLRTPSEVETALALDQRFRLRERAVTALTLDDRARRTPAARALMADVEKHVAPLRIGERFPVRLGWKAALGPAAAALALALIACLYDPRPADAGSPKAEEKKRAADPQREAELERKQKEMQAQAQARKERPPAGEKARALDEEFKRVAALPHETPEEKEELVKRAAALEDRLKQRDQQLADQMKALKEQWKREERLGLLKRDPKAAADGVNQALQQGDLKKAEDELKRLGKELKDAEEAQKQRDEKRDDPKLEKDEKEKLDREQEAADKRKEELKGQLQDLKDRADKLADPARQIKALEEAAAQGKIDKEDLEREKELLAQDQARRDDQDRKDLKDLAEKLGEAEKALKEGKKGEAGRKLQDAARQCAKLDAEGERKELGQCLGQLKGARQAANRALEPQRADDQKGGGVAAGRRPEAKDGATDQQEKRAQGVIDPGQKNVIDFAPAPGLKEAPNARKLPEGMRRAPQEDPDANDRGQLAPGDAAVIRGFFRQPGR